MIIVPRFTHRRDCGPTHVVGLNPGMIDQPGLRSASVRKVTDKPVAVNGNRDASTDSPKDVSKSTAKIECCRNRKLLRHPSFFEETIKGIRANAAEIEPRGTSKVQAAVKLPAGVAQHASAVSKIIMAV
jgi:hypothetical protein